MTRTASRFVQTNPAATFSHLCFSASRDTMGSYTLFVPKGSGQVLEPSLFGAEQVAGGGDADREGAGAVARGVGEDLEGDAVAEGEEVGDDVLGGEAEADDALLLLAVENRGDVGAGALEELTDLFLDVGV